MLVYLLELQPNWQIAQLHLAIMTLTVFATDAGINAGRFGPVFRSPLARSARST